MNKILKPYAGVWAICFALFNAIVFWAPIEHDSGFWVGYAFITVAFLGQFGCTYKAFKAENLKKCFYNVPLNTISYTGLIVMLIAGSVCMVIPGIPNWLGVIVCLVVLGVTAIAVISAGAAGSIVANLDQKVEEKTTFIRNLTIDAENLMNRANAPMLKNQCKKVLEAVRYSDPMSSKELSNVEQRIQEEFDVLTDAVIADDLDCTESAAKELLTLIAERNKKCRAFK
jgi:hypothetical protein